MSNTVIKTKLTDGPIKSIYHFYFEGDGSGEFVNEPIIQVTSDFDPVPVNKHFSIQQIWFSLAYFDLFLAFDDLVSQPSWVLARDTVGYHDFRYFGGLKLPPTIDTAGQLLLTSSGFATPGSKGTLIIEFKKD